MKRITVIMPEETYNKIMVLRKQENRKKSPMALMLIEDGLKLVEKNKVTLYFEGKEHPIDIVK